MLQSDNQAPIAKKARVRTGCYTCRSRKVKCDEGSDPCQNCVKYRRQCVWPTAGGRGRPAHLNGPRAKPPCDSCRLARARCSRDRPCTRCISLSTQSECTYLLSTESHRASAAMGSLTPLHSQRPVSNDREASEDTFDDRSMSLPSQAVPTGTELSQLASPPLNKDAPSPNLVANKRSLGASVGSDRFAVGDNTRAVQTGSAAPHSPSSSGASGSRRPSFGLNLSTHTGMRTNLRILSRCPTPPAFDVEDQRHYKLSFLQNLIDAWFAHVHPAQANGFLHRGTVIRRITDGSLPRRFIIAFSATAGRFRNGAAHESGLEPSLTIPENSWTNVARRLVMMEDKVDIDNVAASMMLYRHFYHCGRFDVAGNFASLGTRQARLLGLYDQSSTTGNGSWVERQLSCRLTWSTLCASLETDPMGTPLSAIKLHLPSEDHNYQLGIPSTTPLFCLDDPDGRDELVRLCAAVLEVLHSEVWGNVGLMGHHVVLKLLAAGITRAWHRINAHNFTRPGENPWNPNSPYQNLINALLTYRSSVPQHVQPTADNLIARASLAESTSLSMLQCQFRAILITAYRPLFLHPRARWPSTSIDLSLAPDGWIVSMRQACITEAHGLCNVVESSGRLIDCEIASWLYQAIHILVVDQLGSSNGGESTESIKLGEWVDNLVMRILPAKRMYWHVGFMTQRIAKLLSAWHVSSILSEQDFGPAAKTILPKWLKRYPLADEISNHVQEPDSSNSFVFTPSLDSVPAPEISSNLGPDPFFRGALFDFGFGYPPDAAGSYGLASVNNSNPSDLPTTLAGPDASSANALLDWLMSMDNAQMDHALDPNKWP